MAEGGASKLNTWKEIARYLGRDERTAKRWEATRGLPVRRAPGVNRSTVYAYSRELDRWLLGASGESGSDTSVSPASGEHASHPPVPEDLLTGGVSRRRPARPWLLLASVAGAACAIGLVYLGVDPGFGQRALDRTSSISGKTAPKTAPEAYMKGLYAWHTRTRAGLADAIADFSRAILNDPRYAPAYVGLADCYNLMPEFGGMTPGRAFPQAKVAAERAIALNDQLAGAHRDLAFVDFWWSHDVARSKREFQRALNLDPKSALTHHWYANVLTMTGAFPEALAEINDAERLDPATTAIRADKAVVLFDAGRSAEAVDILRAITSAEPSFAPAHSYLATIFLARSDEPDAIDEMAAAARLNPDNGSQQVASAAEKGYRQAGRAGMMRAMLSEQTALFRHGAYSPYVLAESYAQTDPDRSFALLDQSLANGEAVIMASKIDPALRPLHGDPRFAALLATLHLPPLSQTG